MKHAIFAIALAAASAAASGARAADPIQLKLGFPAPPMSFVNTRGVTPWIKDVEAAAEGAIEIKLFPGGTLGNFRNIYDRTIAGVSDISFGTPGSEGQTFAKTGVSSLPFESEHSTEASLALWKLFEKNVIADEFDKVLPLALFTFSSSGMHSTKLIKSADDMKGLKLAAGGKTAADALLVLGASPVTMTPAETYQSISRGLVDGANMSWPGVQVFKLFEVAKFHLSVPFGLAAGYIIMNKESYARLPAKAKQAIDRYSYEAFTRRMGTGADAEDEAILARLKKMPGQTFNALSAEEKARWRRILAPVTDAWMRTTPDGPRVLATFRAEIAAALKAKSM